MNMLCFVIDHIPENTTFGLMIITVIYEIKRVMGIMRELKQELGIK